jgi:hypothetical protein
MYTSNIRIKRRKPTTSINRYRASGCRWVLRNRCSWDLKVAALHRLNELAPVLSGDSPTAPPPPFARTLEPESTLHATCIRLGIAPLVRSAATLTAYPLKPKSERKPPFPKLPPLNRERCSWDCMIQRSTNPKRREFKYYGGRGITVCDRWRYSFAAFFEDMGPRPEGTTIDRINPDGNYEPGNCRWATKAVQEKNKRARGGPHGDTPLA